MSITWSEFNTQLLNIRFTYFFSLAILLLLLTNANGQPTCVNVGSRIYVDSVAMGSNDGTSWTDAYSSLSEALATARECDVDTILVAKGTYIPTDSLAITPASDSRHVSFTLPSEAVMLGGFSPADGIDLISERDWEMYPTVLSGDLMQNDNLSYPDISRLDRSPDRADNAFHIINQENSWTGLIDGFCFERGNAIESDFGGRSDRGAAIYLQNCQGDISNCKFTYNAADNYGGAIFIDSISILNGYNLEFNQNYSNIAGGAIASMRDLTLDECRFHQNSSSQGGAISSESLLFLEGGSPTTPTSRNLKKSPEDYNLPTLTIRNSMFSRDTAFLGGAISAFTTIITIDSTSFTHNAAEIFGGAVSAFLGTYTGHSNRFENNIAGASGGALDINGIIPFQGGGFFFNGTLADAMTPKLKESKRLKAAMVPSPIDLINASDASIVNSEFYNNSSGFLGGGISWFGDSLIIKSIIAESNCAAGLGGALNVSGNYANIDSSDFYQNQAGTGGSIHQFGCIQCIFDSDSPDPLEFNYDIDISNSSFSGDSAIVGGSIGVSFGNFTLRKNEFDNNSAVAIGGAIAALASSYEGVQNTFTTNSSGFAGGAVVILNQETFVFEDPFFDDFPMEDFFLPSFFLGPIESCSSFGFGSPFALLVSNKENPTKSATAIMPEFNLNVSFTDDEYTNNNSNSLGGALFWVGDSLTVHSSRFNSNRVEGRGGALYISGNHTRVDSSTFSSNKADFGGSILAETQAFCDECGPPSSGLPSAKGSVFKNAGLPAGSTYTLDVTNSTFQRDSAAYGGSISSFEYDTRVSESIFQHNYANEFGGAIESVDSKYTGHNNIFTLNEAGIGGGAVTTDLCLGCFSAELPSLKSSIQNQRRHNDRRFRNYKRENNLKSAELPIQYSDISTFTNATFVKNTANETGGALHWVGDSLIIHTSRFDSNRVEDGGGALFISGNYASIDSSSFDNNNAEIGGSILAEPISFCFDCPSLPCVDCLLEAPTVKDNTFKNAAMPIDPAYILNVSNSTFQRDSADYGGSISSFEYDTRVSGSTFQYNYANEFGGAIESLDSKYTGKNNLFAFNAAGIGGGAVTTELCLGCFLGPLTTLKSSKSNRHQNIKRRTGNSKKGGNLKSSELPVDQLGISTFTNSTFVFNSANGSRGVTGGALALLDTRDTIINCIIYDNSDFSDQPNSGVFYEDIAFGDDSVYIKNTLLENSGGSGANWENIIGIDGGGNIDDKPLFIDDDVLDPVLGIVGNFRLRPCSPAIDAGTFTPMLNPGSVDLDGNMRLQGATVDMGAYEFEGFPITTRIYVDSAAVTGNNDGSSWDNAFLELYDALYSRCLDYGDTILIARGTYFPDTTELSDYREATFELHDSVVILGGFAPDIGVDDIDERDWDMYESILSGDIGVRGDSLDNAYSIVTAEGSLAGGSYNEVTPAAVLDGLYIEKGNATNQSGAGGSSNGAGIYLRFANPTLKNITFRNNLVTWLGGGIYCLSRDLTIDNCKFIQNKSERSGGALSVNDGKILVENSLFQENFSQSGNLTISGNLARNDTSQIINSVFKNNDSPNSSTVFQSRGHVQIIQSEFANNGSANSNTLMGGTIGTFELINSVFYGNQMRFNSIFSLSQAVQPSALITNSIFWNNFNPSISSSSFVFLSNSTVPSDSVVLFKNSIIERGFGDNNEWNSDFGVDQGGNIEVDPMFVDAAACDFRLQCSSPAIDAGAIDTIGLYLTAFDLSDTTRFIGKMIDIGPHEAQGPCPTIEVSDIAFGEICDTTTVSVFIKSDNIGDLIIDTIISSTPLFTFNLGDFNFPDTIPYCDSTKLDVSYNPTLSGVNTGTITIKSNALSGTDKVINLSGTLDTIPPMMTCSDSTVYLDINGMAVIDTSYFINSLSDNCDIDTVFLSRNSLSCNDTDSPVTITITARDIYGNIQTCTSSLTVLDTISPSLSTQNATVFLDGSGMAILDTSMTISSLSDNCEIDTVYLSQTSFNCDNITSSTQVTTTAKDVNGNTTTSVSTITVSDTIDPKAVCQNITLYLDENGQGLITSADIDGGSSDNCGAPTLSANKVEFACEDIGMQNVTLVAVDASGNENSCTSTVTVIDTIPPSAICQPATIYLDASGTATLLPTMIDNNSSDACGIDSMYVSLANYSCNSTGEQPVTLTVIDNNNNISTCVTTVTVLDTISPIIICKADTVYLGSDSLGVLSTADVNAEISDNCLFKLELSQSSFNCEDIGTNMITLTATDSSDNVSTCLSMVTVLDTIAPIVSCKNITLYVDANGSVNITPDKILQDSSDNCTGITLSTDLSTLECPVGNKNVILTATDLSGNVNSCTAVVTLIDTFPPVITCRDTFIYLDNTGMAVIDESHIITSDDDIFDPCGISGFEFGPKEYDCNNVGVNSVIVGAVDDSGNVDTCTFQLTVIDTISPVVICKNTSIVLGSNGSASLLISDIDDGSTDACGISSYVLSQETFNCEDIGDNQVTLTVTDVNGNTSSCTAVVSVMLPTTPHQIAITGPAIICDNLINLPYSVPATTGLSYQWSYNGTGITIKNNGSAEILIDVDGFTSGSLQLEVYTSCNNLIATASYNISMGSSAFCSLAECLREQLFIDDELLSIATSIDIYKAGKSIQSTAHINAPRSIIFTAGESVDLYPPFEVEKGAVFIAQIESCID